MDNLTKRAISAIVIGAFLLTQCGIGLAAPIYNKVGQNLRGKQVADDRSADGAAGIARALATGAATGREIAQRAISAVKEPLKPLIQKARQRRDALRDGSWSPRAERSQRFYQGFLNIFHRRLDRDLDKLKAVVGEVVQKRPTAIDFGPLVRRIISRCDKLGILADEIKRTFELNQGDILLIGDDGTPEIIIENPSLLGGGSFYHIQACVSSAPAIVKSSLSFNSHTTSMVLRPIDDIRITMTWNGYVRPKKTTTARADGAAAVSAKGSGDAEFDNYAELLPNALIGLRDYGYGIESLNGTIRIAYTLEHILSDKGQPIIKIAEAINNEVKAHDNISSAVIKSRTASTALEERRKQPSRITGRHGLVEENSLMVLVELDANLALEELQNVRAAFDAAKVKTDELMQQIISVSFEAPESQLRRGDLDTFGDVLKQRPNAETTARAEGAAKVGVKAIAATKRALAVDGELGRGSETRQYLSNEFGFAVVDLDPRALTQEEAAEVGRKGNYQFVVLRDASGQFILLGSAVPVELQGVPMANIEEVSKAIETCL